MCGGNVLNMVSYLVISNVTEGDGGLYYCNASAQIVNPAMKSVNVFLVVGMTAIIYVRGIYIAPQ